MKLKTKYSITELAFILLFVGISYKFITSISTYFSGSTSTARYGLLSFIMPLVFVLALWFFFGYYKKITNSLFRSSLLFCIYAVIITVINMNYSFTQLPMLVVNMTYWLVTIFVSYCYKKEHPEEKHIVLYVLLLLFACFPLFFHSISTAKTYAFYQNRDILMNSVYYILFLIPFLLLSKNNLIRTGGLVTIFIAVTVSNKRTALIVYILCVGIWLLFGDRENTIKKRFRTVILVIIGGTIAFFAYNYIISKYDVTLFLRMQALAEGSDNGSGRLQIWSDTFQVMKNENILLNIFGRGYRAVSVGNYTVSESHNDYLQVLFDYGVIGLALLITILINLFSVYFKMKRSHYSHSIVYLISVVMFFCCSMVSQVLIYPYWFLALCLFWGYLYADWEKSEVYSL